ncbi:LacI family transcriptional regulator, partial [Streptomyces turgidiscabies]
DPVPAITRRAGLPAVYGGRPSWTADPGAQAVPYVDADNRGGARLAVRYLKDLGRRHIAHIGGPSDQTSAMDRLDGYRDVLLDVDPTLV